MGGFGQFFRGFDFLSRNSAAWPYALVPTAILIVLLTAVTLMVTGLVHPWIDGIIGGWGEALPSWLAWLGDAAEWFVETLVTLGSFVLLAVVALGVTQPLSGPALEKIVSLQEDDLGVPPRRPIGFLNEIWCGLRAQLFWWTVAMPVVIFLMIVDLFFPPATFVTTPIKFVITALGLAWNLLDYPLTLRAIPMRARFEFMLNHKRELLGFGAAFAVFFLIPCFGVLMLPAASAAATRLLWTIVEKNPDALPPLRPEALALQAAQLREPRPGPPQF